MDQIDIVGDIHGHADKLEHLLATLGYEKRHAAYRHRERMMIFVGDYIDRGPDNPRTVEMVRNMVDAGAAIALCGNHEYNAICFNTATPDGYLRPHSAKNIHQHSATLDQFSGRQDQYEDAINWFKTLPLFYETDLFRVVHASWDEHSIHTLRRSLPDGIIPEELYPTLGDRQSDVSQAIEVTCKGKEIRLPHGMSFTDKDGTERGDIRVKWWINPRGASIEELSVVKGLNLGDRAYQGEEFGYYREDQKPVFFGHYWLQGQPNLYRDNICCLDYSVAKNGYLCCYRYQGEQQLTNDNFVYV